MDKGIAIHTIANLHAQEEEGISQESKDRIRTGDVGNDFGQSSNGQQSIHRQSGKVKYKHVTPSSNDWSFPIW